MIFHPQIILKLTSYTFACVRKAANCARKITGFVIERGLVRVVGVNELSAQLLPGAQGFREAIRVLELALHGAQKLRERGANAA